MGELKVAIRLPEELQSAEPGQSGEEVRDKRVKR
jgi:hypothetical protein